MDSQDNDINNQELMNIFQVETEDIIERIFDSLLKLEKNTKDKSLSASLYRDMHSLKGAIRMVGYSNIQTIIHKIEDIFDTVNSSNLTLDSEKIHIITKAVETVSGYLQESVKNNREMIDGNFNPTISMLEYINNVDLTDTNQVELDNENYILNDITEPVATVSQNIKENGGLSNLQQHQEEINTIFNRCFEIIDDIVPEEESQEIIILKEEVTKIYDLIKEEDLYEIKSALEDVTTKLDFVMNATNIFTISEILELRNTLSSAAAKFNTLCIDDVSSSGISFFDIAEKISMLQSSSVYAEEIKNDILKIKENVSDTGILEIANMLVEIFDFIIENSVQLEEQMAQTLKSALEYCATPNEGIDGDLIIQQLEIMKQLLEINFKKDSGITEIKNLTAQTNIAGKTATEIKTLHVNAQKLDTLVNLLGELIMTKIKAEKSLEKINIIKNVNENAQKDLLKTSNYLRYYNRKYLQSEASGQYTSIFAKQVFTLLSDITQNVSKTIYDLNNLYRSSKEDDIKIRLIIDEMESMVKNIRVLPISTVFNSFTRMVRDIASEKNKDIDFEIRGNDTCADKKIIEEIKTPLMHILRNAIDHGIESKEDRLLAGKSPVGKIVLAAKQDDDRVVIDVIDDGQGFNLQKIKDRAVSRGFLTQEDIDTMTDDAIMNIIFWPGFTTGDSITSISGRGIGLDVVKTKISQLNGKVKVISEFGKGSCVHIEIPVTLATLRVFLVKISEQVFAIPIQMITTFVLKKQEDIKTNNGNRTILYNDNILPLYYLSDILGLPATPRGDKETVLIIESDDKSIGLVVDKLLGDQDILQKKLSPPLYKVKNISGITNLASGEICLILNMQDILNYNFNKVINTQTQVKLLPNDAARFKKILVVDDSMTTRTMMKNILQNAGYGVEAIHDATEALVKLKMNHYDLIITDLDMPKMDGFGFIEILKNDEMYMDIPIIVMSSKQKESVIEQLKPYKIQCYIQKDLFNQDEFMETINSVLGAANG